MAATSLAQLLAAPTQAVVYQRLLGKLQAANFPTTDWIDGGPEKTIIALVAEAVADYVANTVPAIAGGGLVDYSTGAWLDLLAQEGFQLSRNAALSTIGTVVLYCATGAGPYTINTGTWFLAASGNRYFSTGGGTLRPPGFSTVTHLGLGTGTVAAGGTSNGGVSVSVTIEASGTTFSVTTTGGYPVTGTTPGAQYPTRTTTGIPIMSGSAWPDPLTGITVTLTGSGWNPGDVYSFQTYGCLPVSVQSESPNNSAAGLNYVDGVGTITQMITPLPGVTCNNPGSTFSAVTKTGQGVGTFAITPTSAGTPVTASQIAIAITSTGQAGAATWTYSINGGAPSAPSSSASQSIAGNITITLVNDATANPSFIAGDAATFTAPGSWVTQQGTDAEKDAALQLRCKLRWPLLAAAPTLSTYQALALNASSQVTQALAVTDGTVPGQVDIFIAGQSGPVPDSVVNAVQAYILARCPMTDLPVTVKVRSQAIILGGTIYYRAAAGLAAVQAAVQAALQNYIASVGVGGTSNAGIVRLAGCIDAIMNVAGVVDVQSLTINASASNLTLASYAPGTVPTAPQVATLGAVAGMFAWSAL